MADLSLYILQKCVLFLKLNFYTQFCNSKKLRQCTQHSDYSTGWMVCVANTGIKKKKALWPMQPPIWWVPELFPQGKSGWGVRLVTYLHLVPRGKNGCIHISSAVCAMAYIRVDLTFKNWLSISIDEFV